MNTNMSNNYYEMHIDVLELCEQHGIRLIPGKRVSREILDSTGSNGLKDFFLVPDDMEKFLESCADKLQAKGYIVQPGKIKGGKICRIYRSDMLAATVSAVMNNPQGKHFPQFIIRGLISEGSNYSFTSNGKTFTFPLETLNDIGRISYMGSFVYGHQDLAVHIEKIYGADNAFDNSSSEYSLFTDDCTQEEFISEAVRRGYLSEERILRYKEHSTWRKENRSAVEREYREYQEILLGLK